MLIPFFLLMAAPLVMAPLGIAHLYQSEIQWQERQVLLDNAAIILGREVRTLLNRLLAAENELRTHHNQLHRALACSAIPATALSCRALAVQIQALILSKSWRSLRQAQKSWEITKLKTSNDLKIKSSDFIFVMENTLPVSRLPCSHCQLPRYWLVYQPKLRMSAWDKKNDDRSVAVSFEKVQSNRTWNFRLWGSAFQKQQEIF